MVTVPSALRVLPLPVADLLVAGVLYDRLWPAAGLLLATVGVLVLCSIGYRVSVATSRSAVSRAAR